MRSQPAVVLPLRTQVYNAVEAAGQEYELAVEDYHDAVRKYRKCDPASAERFWSAVARRREAYCRMLALRRG